MTTKLNGLTSLEVKASVAKEKPQLDKDRKFNQNPETATYFADLFERVVNDKDEQTDPVKDLVTNLLFDLECIDPDIRREAYLRLDFYVDVVDNLPKGNPLRETIYEIKEIYDNDRH